MTITTLRRYLVWDALNANSEDGRHIVAADAERAAQLFAETDRDGQAEGLYTADGHPLRVRDGAGDEHEVMIVISHSTNYEARPARRKQR